MTNLRLEKRGNVWQYSFEAARVGGKRKRISKSGFRTKAEASAAGAKAMNEYKEYGKQITQSNISYADFLAEWIDKYCIPNLKRTTIADYQYIAKKYICPDLGKYRIREITTELLQDFIVKYAKSGMSHNELLTFKAFFSGTFKYARKRDFIKANPAEDIDIPAVRSDTVISRSRPNSYIPENKMQLILAAFKDNNDIYLPLLLGYKCGLRRGETFGLFWEDIDFEHKTLSVNQQLQVTKAAHKYYVTNPKYNSFRTIEKKLQQEQDKEKYGKYYTCWFVDKDAYINSSGDGKEVHPINVKENGSWIFPASLYIPSKKIKQELGVPEFTYHSLRHTHCTMLLENGAPPMYVKNRLGHKNIQVTLQVYQHYTEKMQEQGNIILKNIFT